MTRSSRFALVAALVAFATALSAQTVPTPPAAPPERKSDVTVTGHIFKPTELPPPDVAKLRVPAGFRIELMDDPDAKLPVLPVSHWVVWNVPVGVTGLREGLQAADRLQDPKGLCQGRNSSGKVGYADPKLPAGDTPHKYHVQVFAVDTLFDLPIGAKRADVLAVMSGHVLAAGDLVGTFARPSELKKP